jgi:hypothetical protein
LGSSHDFQDVIDFGLDTFEAPGKLWLRRFKHRSARLQLGAPIIDVLSFFARLARDCDSSRTDNSNRRLEPPGHALRRLLALF